MQLVSFSQNMSGFFLSNGYTVLCIILYVFPTSTQKAGTHTSNRNFSSMRLILQWPQKLSGFHDSVYHEKRTHEAKRMVQRAESTLKRCLRVSQILFLKYFFQTKSCRKLVLKYSTENSWAANILNFLSFLFS